MAKHYLTSDRFEELQKELEELKTTKRIEISERLKRAKEYGDLSENAEYSEAKDEQAQVETRIFELEEMLKNVSIIKKNGAKDTVTIGGTVIVEKDGKELTFQVVGSNEARPEEGRISNESPIGVALLGKKVGDKAVITAPSGKVEYKIVRIE